MKRNCRFEVRLSKQEYEDLSKKAKKAGLSAGAFVRQSIAAKEVKSAPTVDVAIMTNELRRIGYNLNQTLTRMNSTGVLDMPRFREDLNDIHKATKLITDAYSTTED